MQQKCNAHYYSQLLLYKGIHIQHVKLSRQRISTTKQTRGKIIIKYLWNIRHTKEAPHAKCLWINMLYKLVQKDVRKDTFFQIPTDFSQSESCIACLPELSRGFRWIFGPIRSEDFFRSKNGSDRFFRSKKSDQIGSGFVLN